MNISANLETAILAAEAFLGDTEKPRDTEADLLLAIVDAYRESIRLENAQKEKDEKEGSITTPQQLREHVERIYRRQIILNPDNAAHWDEIVKWAEDYTHDSEVDRLLAVYNEPAEDDEIREDAIHDLFDYLLVSTENDSYGHTTKKVVTLTLYGGGPAGGLIFAYDEEDTLEKVEAWHTEWFSSPVTITLSDDEGERLASVYGMYHLPD